MNAVAKTSPKVKRIKYDSNAPAIVIAMGSPKGGPGKSTLAVALAAEFGRRCAGPVTVVDLDITANAYVHLTKAAGQDKGIPAAGHHMAALAGDYKALATQLSLLKRSNQVLILDTPGAIENIGAQFALSASDIVVVPSRLAPYDLQATFQGLELMAPLRARNPDQVQMVVVNSPDRTVMSRDVLTALANGCAEHDVKVAKTMVRKSVVFLESSATGHALYMLGSKAEGPSQDIADLADEILSALNR